MKTVLFATTALVAFAGAASAASHDSGATVSFSGNMTAGYNDAVKGGLYYDTDLDLAASVDFGDNVTAKLTYQLVSTADNVEAGTDIDPTVEITYTGGSLTASLKYGDLGDKGASEYFYGDRDGMAVDVENHDADRDVRALLEFGSFGVAAGCQITGLGDCAGLNVGAGATFGSIELGVGYDDGSSGQTAVTAVSADATFGSFEVGVSYATSTPENSVGVTVDSTFGAIKVGAYYASNSASSNAYGVSVDYAAGALTLGAYYDSATINSYGVDVGYAVSDSLTASAGYFNGEASVYTAGTKADTVGSYYYVGIEYTVNDNISATVSYATANEISGPEFKQGISAFISADF